MAQDAHFYKVGLLLHGDGADGAATFPDSSVSSHFVSPAGGALVSTLQSKFGGASLKFNSGNYLTIPSSAAFGFGTGDFTIEFWVYPTLTGDANNLILDFRSSDAAVPLAIGLTSAGAVRYYDGATVRTGGTLTANTWAHIAWCRSSNVNNVYVNGVSVSTYTASQDFGASKPLCIGTNVVKSAERFIGHVDDIRITKGVARYTGTFTPPTEAFSEEGPPADAPPGDLYFDRVSLLLHLSGASGSTTITDSSTTAKTITALGGAALSTTEAKFSGTSCFFDRVDDRLEVTGHNDFLFGTGDFTWECWAYFTSYTGNQTLISLGTNRTFYLASNGNLYYYEPNVSNNVVGVACPINQWVHCALSRVNGTLYLFVNGVGSSAAYTVNLTENTIWLGKYQNISSPMGGYIDEVRITKGVGRYTSNFVPPTAPFPNLGYAPETGPSKDGSFSQVSLLLHCDGANGSTALVDSSPLSHTVTAAGTGAISTAKGKSGGASLLTGTAGAVIPSSTAFDFGSGDMTIEMWFAFTATTSDCTILSREWVASPWTGGWVVQLRASAGGPIRVYMADWSSGGPLMVGTTTSHGDGQWHHLAWTREGSVHRLFLDGFLEATATTSAAFASVSKRISIGHDLTFGSRAINGYVDEVRITKGLARYTTNFARPAAPFPGPGQLSGVVKNISGVPSARLVRALREDTGQMVGEVISDGVTGAYSITAGFDGAHTLVAYPADGENLPALTLRGVLPA